VEKLLRGSEGRVLHSPCIRQPFPNLIEDLLCSISEVLMSLKIKWEKIGKQVESGTSSHVSDLQCLNLGIGV
jgi:hypothetical protein